MATASTRLKLLPEVEAGDGSVPLVYRLCTVSVLVYSKVGQKSKFKFFPKKYFISTEFFWVYFCLVLFVGALTCCFETSFNKKVLLLLVPNGRARCLDRHISLQMSLTFFRLHFAFDVEIISAYLIIL